MKSITLYKDRAGKIRWRMKVNGRILASPEGFERRSGAVNNLCAILRVMLLSIGHSDDWSEGMAENLRSHLDKLTVTPRK